MTYQVTTYSLLNMVDIGPGTYDSMMQTKSKIQEKSSNVFTTKV